MTDSKPKHDEDWYCKSCGSTFKCSEEFLFATGCGLLSALANPRCSKCGSKYVTAICPEREEPMQKEEDKVIIHIECGQETMDVILRILEEAEEEGEITTGPYEIWFSR